MKLATIFTDKMVLQRDMPIRIFGTGDGEVTVRFLGETVSGKSESGIDDSKLCNNENIRYLQFRVDVKRVKIVMASTLNVCIRKKSPGASVMKKLHCIF